MTSHIVTNFFQTYLFGPTGSRDTSPSPCIASITRRTLLSFRSSLLLISRTVTGSFGIFCKNSFMRISDTVIQSPHPRMGRHRFSTSQHIPRILAHRHRCRERMRLWYPAASICRKSGSFRHLIRIAQFQSVYRKTGVFRSLEHAAGRLFCFNQIASPHVKNYDNASRLHPSTSAIFAAFARLFLGFGGLHTWSHGTHIPDWATWRANFLPIPSQSVRYISGNFGFKAT